MQLTDADIIAEAIKRGLVSDGRWEELAERAVGAMLAELVDAQSDFILDLSPLSAAYCTRQCGKTFTVARDLIVTALERPNRLCTYINATHGEARRIMWDDPVDGVPAVLRRHGLDEASGVRLNITRMSVTFPNGSVVECMGMDSAGYSKIRGNKRDLIVVDEAQKAAGLREAMADLTWCLMARAGRLRFIGTPNRMCRGYFHDVCTGAVDGWSVRRWSMADVTTRPEMWQRALEMKARLKQADDDPDWLREGCGLWVRSEAGLILPVDLFGALHDGVPSVVIDSGGGVAPRREALRYLAGVDLGFVNDPFAIVVIAYSMDEGVVYEVESGEWANVGTDGQAELMKQAQRRWPGLNKFVVDDGGQGKQIADDFRKRHGINVVPARKHDRVHMIEELRTSLRLRQTLVRRGSPLHSDLSTLSWDEELWERGEYQPANVDGRSIDHKFDAFRYAWREARAYLAQRPPAPEPEGERRLREVAEHRRDTLDPRKRAAREAAKLRGRRGRGRM